MNRLHVAQIVQQYKHIRLKAYVPQNSNRNIGTD